jgi:hypothetical protein
METQPSPGSATFTVDPASTPAEELPGLYRAILDRVAALEQIGERVEAGRIRMLATDVYSAAWNENGRNRLLNLLGRADRSISGHDQPRGWTLRRRSLPAR